MVAMEVHFVTGMLMTAFIVLVISQFKKGLFDYTPIISFFGGLWAVIPEFMHLEGMYGITFKSDWMNIFMLNPLMDTIIPKLPFLRLGRTVSFLILLIFFTLFVLYFVKDYMPKKEE